jgi:hypothetical protein
MCRREGIQLTNAACSWRAWPISDAAHRRGNCGEANFLPAASTTAVAAAPFGERLAGTRLAPTRWGLSARILPTLRNPHPDMKPCDSVQYSTLR